MKSAWDYEHASRDKTITRRPRRRALPSNNSLVSPLVQRIRTKYRPKWYPNTHINIFHLYITLKVFIDVEIKTIYCFFLFIDRFRQSHRRYELPSRFTFQSLLYVLRPSVLPTRYLWLKCTFYTIIFRFRILHCMRIIHLPITRREYSFYQNKIKCKYCYIDNYIQFYGIAIRVI